MTVDSLTLAELKSIEMIKQAMVIGFVRSTLDWRDVFAFILSSYNEQNILGWQKTEMRYRFAVMTTAER